VNCPYDLATSEAQADIFRGTAIASLAPLIIIAERPDDDQEEL
jgi:hypothetical protein